MTKSERPVRLLQISDPHLFADPGGTHRGQNTLRSLRAVLDHARGQTPADAVLVTGDTVQDESREGYHLFKRCFAGWRVPVLCLPGNHDNTAVMADELDEFPASADGCWCCWTPRSRARRAGASSPGNSTNSV